MTPNETSEILRFTQDDPRSVTLSDSVESLEIPTTTEKRLSPPNRVKPVLSKSLDPAVAAPLTVKPGCDYILVMNTVNVATLKEKLSYYLGLVKKGQEIVVTSHRHRVARILPASAPDAQVAEPSRPVKDLRKIKGVRSRGATSGVKTLLEDRRRR